MCFAQLGHVLLPIVHVTLHKLGRLAGLNQLTLVLPVSHGDQVRRWIFLGRGDFQNFLDLPPPPPGGAPLDTSKKYLQGACPLPSPSATPLMRLFF